MGKYLGFLFFAQLLATKCFLCQTQFSNQTPQQTPQSSQQTPQLPQTPPPQQQAQVLPQDNDGPMTQQQLQQALMQGIIHRFVPLVGSNNKASTSNQPVQTPVNINALDPDKLKQAEDRLKNNPFAEQDDNSTLAGANSQQTEDKWWEDKSDKDIAAKYHMTPKQFRKATDFLLKWMDDRMVDLDNLYEQTLAFGKISGIPVDRILNEQMNPVLVKWAKTAHQSAGNPFAKPPDRSKNDGHVFPNPIKQVCITVCAQFFPSACVPCRCLPMVFKFCLLDTLVCFVHLCFCDFV
eukprot:c11855_g1_i2.p1 GENE.c11855_g1_i2~~c11855_g1_i2.p1  ORF type:complete len:293 (+),score=85.09 c11855_g1_i2:39-917(+)